MAKKSTGLGKGLDSLIPDFYDEDFDSNSAVSLEDMLGEDEKQEESNEDIVENVDEDNSSNEEIIYTGILNEKAYVLATAIDILVPVNEPGPLPTIISSNSLKSILLLLNASSIVGTK